MPAIRRQRRGQLMLPSKLKNCISQVDITEPLRPEASPTRSELEPTRTSQPTSPIASDPIADNARDVNTLDHDVQTESSSSKECVVPEEPIKPLLNQCVGGMPSQDTLAGAVQKGLTQAQANGLNPWLKSPMNWTSIPIVDQVMNDVRLSRYGLWPGNPKLVARSCVWRSGDRPSVATLQWKENAPNRPEEGGDATIVMVASISPEGNNSDPAGGWVTSYKKETLHKHQRSFRLVDPGASSNIPLIWWETQLNGALQMVEDGSTPPAHGSHTVTHCFANKDGNYIRIRSPLFVPNQVAQSSEDDDTESDSSSEEGVPEGFEFSTWNFNSHDVKEAFGQVLERGFHPIHLPAYTRANKLIHPNNVSSTLTGALVVLYCTLSRVRFTRDKGERTEYQYYANLIKVQVLKTATPAKSVSKKRKFVHSYDPKDSFGPDGRSSDGPVPSKKLKLVLSAE